MSDENQNKKAREPKKNSIPFSEVETMTAGIPQYKKASFLVVGHKNGVRLALPLTNGVSRGYFYANGDYSLIPTHDSIKVLSVDDRKEQNRGGIMAELDASLGVEALRQGLELLVEAVRYAPEPKKKERPTPKAKATTPTEEQVLMADGEFTPDGADLADESIEALGLNKA